MADALEAFGEGVEQETSQELVGGEGHLSGRVVVLSVDVSEGDLGLVEAQDAGVADGDAVGVAGEIVEGPLGPVERRLGIDDPLFGTEETSEGAEGALIRQMRDLAREDEESSSACLLEVSEELAAEESRENAHGEEELAAPLGRHTQLCPSNERPPAGMTQ